MTEIPIILEPGFDPRPDWYKKFEEAVDEAVEAGWKLKAPVVFEGDPYVWEGEPRVATWTYTPNESQDIDTALKTPQEWQEQIGARILDPDGWRFRFRVKNETEYQPRSFEDRITKLEFENRLAMSTSQVVRKNLEAAEEDPEPQPKHGDHGTCAKCGNEITYWGPTREDLDDGWWAHVIHDAVLGGPA